MTLPCHDGSVSINRPQSATKTPDTEMHFFSCVLRHFYAIYKRARICPCKCSDDRLLASQVVANYHIWLGINYMHFRLHLITMHRHQYYYHRYYTYKHGGLVMHCCCSPLALGSLTWCVTFIFPPPHITMQCCQWVLSLSNIHIRVSRQAQSRLPPSIVSLYVRDY